MKNLLLILIMIAMPFMISAFPAESEIKKPKAETQLNDFEMTCDENLTPIDLNECDYGIDYAKGNDHSGYVIIVGFEDDVPVILTKATYEVLIIQRQELAKVGHTIEEVAQALTQLSMRDIGKYNRALESIPEFREHIKDNIESNIINRQASMIYKSKLKESQMPKEIWQKARSHLRS